MRRALLAALVSTLLTGSAPVAGAQESVAETPASASSFESTYEEIAESIGLFGSSIDIDELDASGETLQNATLPEAVPDEVEEEPPRFEPFVAPIPFRSPSLGWGGALTVGTLVRIDPDDFQSPPSTVAGGGFGTENESFGGVFVFNGHLREDLLRPRLVFAQGRANYEFFGIGSDAGSRGISADLRTEFLIARLTGLVRLPTADWGRLGRQLYLGPVIEFRINDHSVRKVPLLPPGFPLPSFEEEDLALGVALERDTRDNRFAPTAGTLFQFTARVFSEDLTSDEDYQTYDLSLASFHQLPFDTVLGWRGLSRFGGGDVPFNELGQHDLRGYERGRYRDEVHVAGELELRRTIYKRFGGVVYTGLGQVGPSIDDLEGDNLLWSVGFGLRFQLTKQSPLNYRTDLGWGRDGFEFYFSLGEEF